MPMISYVSSPAPSLAANGCIVYTKSPITNMMPIGKSQPSSPSTATATRDALFSKFKDNMFI